MRDNRERKIDDAVEQLIVLYDHPFGGKKRGRYRVSMKLMCRFLDQRRIWPEQIEAIRRGLYERGYILIDLETYFAIVSQQTFASYRRVNEAAIVAANDVSQADRDAEPAERTEG